MTARLLGGDPAAAGLLQPGRPVTASVGFLAAVLSFLAVLALALLLAAGRLSASWQGELAGTATLQIFGPEAQIEEQARAALEVLRTTPGVRSVRMVDLAEQERLLEPWLGPDVPVESLPLPLMVDVDVDRTALDHAALVERLQAEAPGAVYDDHAGWREPLIATAERVRVFAIGCLGLVALSLAVLVGLAARAELAANGGAIATLRLVGARDRLIRGAVSRRLAVGAAAGAVAGTAAGLALVALLPQGSEQGFFLAGIGLAGWHWLLPLVGAAGGRGRRLGERRRRRPARAAALELTAVLLLRSLVFDFLLYTTMAVMGVLGAPLALWSVDGAYAVCRAYCRVVFFYLRVICGLRVEVRGRVPKGEVLVAAKHQSFLDILIIFEALPRAKFIMKKELRWAPFIGLYALRIGSTPVSRGDRSKAMKAMVEHAGKAEEARQLVIYPQGTRVAPGARPPFKVGAGVLYERLGTPCVPAATNAGVFWGRRSLHRRPGLAVVEFLPPIPPGLEIPVFMGRIEAEVEAASDRLMREAGFDPGPRADLLASGDE